MNRNRKTILVLSAAVFVAVALVGFGAMAGYQQWVSNQEIEPPNTTPEVSETSNATSSFLTPPSFPQKISLSISNLPALNQTAILTCKILSKEEVSNTTIKIDLPEGFELVSGNLTWKDSDGNVTVKAVKTGNWTITASANHYVFTDEGVLRPSWGSEARIYVAVRENTAWIRETAWPVPKSNWYDYTQPFSEAPLLQKIINR